MMKPTPPAAAPPEPDIDPLRAQVHALVDQLLDLLWSSPATHAVGSPPVGGDVLTIEESAALCRVSVDVLYRLAAEGSLPAAKVGGQWRVLRSELMRWLTEGAERQRPKPARGRAARSVPKPPATGPGSIQARLMQIVKGT